MVSACLFLESREKIKLLFSSVQCQVSPKKNLVHYYVSVLDRFNNVLDQAQVNTHTNRQGRHSLCISLGIPVSSLIEFTVFFVCARVSVHVRRVCWIVELQFGHSRLASSWNLLLGIVDVGFGIH